MKPVHYAIEYGPDGFASALYWSPQIQANREARISAMQKERAERDRQARKPAAPYVEWAKKHGVWK